MLLNDVARPATGSSVPEAKPMAEGWGRTGIDANAGVAIGFSNDTYPVRGISMSTKFRLLENEVCY